MRQRLADEDETVRWAAALTAARLRSPALLPQATDELRRWADRPVSGSDRTSPWLGDREDLAVAELYTIDPDGRADRIHPAPARTSSLIRTT
ncbi:hypothetical protein AB0F72_21930 [Actinoplanes sp. NPDC023936]|uniref:hypothetical protein n=1 Tax=Actinoplanes sp. NPDC023936 TaxID=3154910 RepID=UPI0034054D8E